MRIIAGIAKGQPLAVPRGGLVRPTSDRVRGAIFSSLAERVVGATVLDLFAGSGALGLEAASRGARAVTFVENAASALAVLERNIAACRRNRMLTTEFHVVRGDARQPRGRFDLVFADPPYGGLAQELLSAAALLAALTDKGLLVLESSKRDMVVAPVAWMLERDTVYGDTRVRVLRRQRAVD